MKRFVHCAIPVIPSVCLQPLFLSLCLFLQACKIVLQLPGTSEGVKGYNELCRAIVVLMSCNIDYSRLSGDLQGRVVVSEND